MQGPWENNEIYTLRHGSGDKLWNVIPHCHELRWALQMKEKKRKVSSHKGEGACTKVQRPEIPWVYEKWAWSIGCKRGSHWEGGWVCAMRDLESHGLLSSPCCHPKRSLVFISSFTHSSEKQQGQEHRMEEWEPIRPFKSKRGKTSIAK